MARIPDETRDAVAADLRAGKPRNQIARDHNVSAGSVTNIAREIGVAAGDRSATKHATEARKVDLAAERTRLAGLLMKDAFRLRERAWESQYQVVVVPMRGGGASTEVVAVPTSAGDFRNFYTSIGIIVDKVAVLTRDDSDGLAAVDSWLRSLGAGATS